jgi:hypothetical protein
VLNDLTAYRNVESTNEIESLVQVSYVLNFKLDRVRFAHSSTFDSNALVSPIPTQAKRLVTPKGSSDGKSSTAAAYVDKFL